MFAEPRDHLRGRWLRLHVIAHEAVILLGAMAALGLIAETTRRKYLRWLGHHPDVAKYLPDVCAVREEPHRAQEKSRANLTGKAQGYHI